MLFACLAIASTWPLATRYDTALALGTEPTATVPMLNVWTIGWNVDRMRHGYRDYWDAPIYFPIRDALALSEPLPLAGILAWPVMGQQFGPIAVYNLLLWLFLTLNGWIACRLLKRLRLSSWAAVAGGAMLCLLPIVHWQLGVVQMVSLWGVVATLAALRRVGQRCRLRDGIPLGIAFAATYLLCSYVGLMLSILLILATPFWFGRRWRSGRWWLSLGVALLTAGVLSGPVAWRQYVVGSLQGVEYSEQTLASLSVVPADYWTTPWPQWVPLPSLPRAADALVWPLSPGTLKYMVALCGCIYGLRSKRYRRWTWFLLALLIAAAVLAMGPRLSWHGHGLYHFLAAWYPGYGHIRNLFRFAYFVQLAVVLLAALGLHGIATSMRRHHRYGRVGAATWLIVAGGMLTLEAWPAEPRTWDWNNQLQESTWVRWLARGEQADVRLVCLPLAPNRSADAHAETTVWMVCQLWHFRPMVNGYSASIPDEYLAIESALTSFPDRLSVDALHDAGVTHCLLDARAGQPSEATLTEPRRLAALGFRLECDDRQQGVQIWRLPQRP